MLRGARSTLRFILMGFGLIGFGLSGFGLSGCNRAIDSGKVDRGRYTGIGIYNPGRLWTKMISAEPPSDPQAAQRIDDQVVIVVQDSITGEVRACGDLTGYCIGMNPWKSDLASSQVAPVKLTEHWMPEAPRAEVKFTVKHDAAERPRPGKKSEGDSPH